jgi:prophage DNA circulation protein
VVDFIDQLRPASFRGIRFHVPEAESTLGRRWITHVYPLRDDPGHEDLGRRPREMAVTAVIVGDDVLAQARQLEEALEAAGAGRLVHPWYGEMDAVVIDVSARQSEREGRLLAYQIVFQRYAPVTRPGVQRNTAGTVYTRADTLLGALDADFGGVVSLAGRPAHVISAIRSELGGIGVAVDEAFGAYGLLREGRGALAPLLGALDAGAIRNPAAILGTVTDAVRAVSSLTGIIVPPAIGAGPDVTPAPGAFAPADILDGLLSAASTLPEPVRPSPTTPSRLAIGTNAEAAHIAALGTLTAEAARTAAVVSFPSRKDAERARDRLVERMDVLGDRAAALDWHETGSAVADLRAATSRDLTERAGRLPGTLAVQPPAGLPGLLVAQHLYGDDPAALMDRVDDLVRRNGLQRAGFLPPDALEMLDLRKVVR